MTTRTHRVKGIYGVGFICGVAGLLLAGCTANPESHQQFSMVKAISDQPVYSAISADDVKMAKVSKLAVLALPYKKSSSPIAKGELSAENRLALLRGTVPAVTVKGSAFAALSDGPLAAAEIQALFMGLDVMTSVDNHQTHRFFRNGDVEGNVVDPHGKAIVTPTNYDDSGNWFVSKSARICMDWFDWYTGDRTCYRVTKLGNSLMLTSDRQVIDYAILN
jgi:hypothetical protein